MQDDTNSILVHMDADFEAADLLPGLVSDGEQCEGDARPFASNKRPRQSLTGITTSLVSSSSAWSRSAYPLPALSLITVRVGALLV